MESTIALSNRSWKFTLFFSLTFLIFFQLTSDFIESIYTFGLLGTNIPPEIVSIVFFFSPLALLFFRRLPRRGALVLAGVAALLRGLELVLDPSGKMLASGLGVGVLLITFPILLANLTRQAPASALELGSGLCSAVAISILLRALGAGSDLSLLIPWISWLLCALLIGLAILLLREKLIPEPADETVKSGFCPTAALSAGFLGALLMLYFAFTSPTVLSRWTSVDYRLILLTLGAAWSIFIALLTADRIRQLSRPLLAGWNGLFLLAGTSAILINQVRFPADAGGFPLYQPGLPWAAQIPLFIFLLLSPVILLDFILLAGEFAWLRPTTRQLAGGFTIAALAFLVVVLAQVFTTVYDYIPVVGPWFRDQFWLVFLLTGLTLTVPLFWARQRSIPGAQAVQRQLFLPLVVTALVLSIVVAVINEPEPEVLTQPSTLRVVTYNLQQGYDQVGQRAYQRQMEVIRSLEPDLVGLQESDVARFSGGNADLVRTLAEGLNMYAYYGPKTVAGTFGIALLSRYPLENPQTFFMFSVGEQTAAITAQVTVNNVPYQILVTHLGNDGPIIQQQQVLQELAGKRNIIAMGDFNFRPTSAQYALTDEMLDSAWVLAGSPLTAGLDPERLIDHIFVSPGTKVKSAEYVVSPVSDHPGLLVEIEP